MKYMLMMHAPKTTGDWQVTQWAQEDFAAHIAFMKRFAAEWARPASCGAARRRRASRGHRLAADPGDVRPVAADLGQPDGRAQLRDCHGHGRGRASRARPARRHCPGRTASGTSSLDAVRARLLEMAGDIEGTPASYGEAAGRTASVPERNYLVARAARLAPARP